MANINWEEVHDIISQLKSKGYSWRDIAGTINEDYGTDLSSDACRKREYRFLRSRFEDATETDGEEVQLMLDLQVERYKPLDYYNQANRYMRRVSREETCKDIANMFAEKMASSYKFPPIKGVSLTTADCGKEGILCISDWHYGIEINNYNNIYNMQVAKNRINELLSKTISHVHLYHLNKMHVVNLGDMIAGRIHSQIKMESRVDSVTQIMEVSELIACFLQELSKYVKIDYYEVLDNHSRLEPNIKESLELESLARIIGFYLKQRLKDNHNVCIKDNEYGLDIASFNVLGHNVAGVHGDKDKQKKVIDSLTLYTREFFDLILTAHLHHFSADEQNETIRISNGSLMGTDSFAQKLRLNSKPSQTLIVSTADNVLYAVHKIDLK